MKKMLPDGIGEKIDVMSKYQHHLLRTGKLSKEEIEEKSTMELIDDVCNTYGEQPITEKDILNIQLEVARMLRSGKIVNECIDYIVTTYPFIKKDRARLIVNIVRKEIRKEYDEYVKDIAYENINTLIQIRNDALANSNKTVAIQAIDVINKMTGQYVNKEEVKVKTDEPMIIKFK